MLARKQAENMATKEREKEELVELTSGATGWWGQVAVRRGWWTALAKLLQSGQWGHYNPSL